MSAPVDEAPWRRLSARMLLIHPLRSLKELLPGLLPVLLVGNTRSDAGSQWWNIAAGVFVLVVAVVTWATTTYRVADSRVQHRRGLLRREVVTVPLDRVRSVDVQASPIHRILGLVTVRVGTGVAGGKPLVLDGLTTEHAEQLRRGLLDRARAASEPPLEPYAEPDPSGVEPPGRAAPEPAPATVLARFTPSWVRFAPLSTSGLLTAVAVLGFVSQLAGEVLSDDDWERVGSRALQLGLAGGLVVGGLALTAVVVGCAVVAYLLAYWGHEVSRLGRDQLQVRRGLLTVRSTTLDLTRLRGVQLGETLPMRLAGGASLRAVTTGLGGDQSDAGPGSGAGTGLLPPAPRASCRDLAALLLGDDSLGAPVRRHGPAARRRRWTRALWTGVLALVAGVLLVRWQDLSWWWAAPCAVPLLAAPALAEDRYRQLGHAVVAAGGRGRRLVARRGSLHRRTVVLDPDGVVGWTVRETFWQRRAGVATLVAATAAGAQHYEVVDLPVGEAWPVARTVTPQVFAGEG